MAGGNNHAKQIVVDEANNLVSDLQNGKSGDAETQGKATGLLLQMVIPLFEAEFVTVEECQRVHKVGVKSGKTTKIKIGPVQIEGQLTTALLMNSFPFACCAALFFCIGKLQAWW